jgi:hypothetical protein
MHLNIQVTVNLSAKITSSLTLSVSPSEYWHIDHTLTKALTKPSISNSPLFGSRFVGQQILALIPQSFLSTKGSSYYRAGRQYELKLRSRGQGITL